MTIIKSRLLVAGILTSVAICSKALFAENSVLTPNFIMLPGEICISQELEPFLLDMRRELGTGQVYIRINERSEWSRSNSEAHQLLEDNFVYVFSGESNLSFTRLDMEGSVLTGNCVNAQAIYSELIVRAQQDVEASFNAELQSVNQLLEEAVINLDQMRQERDETAKQSSMIESALAQALLERDQRVAAIASVQEQLEQALVDLSRSEDVTRALERQVQALRVQVAEGTEVQADLTVLQPEDEGLRADLAASRQEALNAQTKAADLEEQLAIALASREDLQFDRDDLAVRLAAAVAAREALETGLSDLQNSIQNSKLADELARALEAKLSAEANLAGAQYELNELKKQFAQLLAQRALADQDAADRLSEEEQRAAFLFVTQRQLAAAQQQLADANELTADQQRDLELLNQQVAQLRLEMGRLQTLLDEAEAKDIASQVQITNLGSRLNTALTRAAETERRLRRLVEERNNALLQAERDRLAAENADLERYRSDFFGRLRELIGDREGVQIVGDRFVFSSEVLFQSGEAELSEEGQAAIANVAGLLRDVTANIPAEIDWIIRVDGHTDAQRVLPGGEFADNWELSQARALSVVRDLVNVHGLEPQRLSANGFGEFQPINPARTADAFAENRRLEISITER